MLVRCRCLLREGDGGEKEPVRGAVAEGDGGPRLLDERERGDLFLFLATGVSFIARREVRHPGAVNVRCNADVTIFPCNAYIQCKP